MRTTTDRISVSPRPYLIQCTTGTVFPTDTEGVRNLLRCSGEYDATISHLGKRLTLRDGTTILPATFGGDECFTVEQS